MVLYRVYFNRLNEAPQVWSVDEGDQTSEINVIAVSFRDCEVRTMTDLDETDVMNKPRAWMQARGMLRVEHGVAIIEGEV